MHFFSLHQFKENAIEFIFSEEIRIRNANNYRKKHRKKQDHTSNFNLLPSIISGVQKKNHYFSFFLKLH